MNDAALFNWIKKEQTEKLEFAEKKAIRRFKEDDLYVKMLKELVKRYNTLKVKEKIFLVNLANCKQQSKNFSDGQRSAITNMFYKNI